MVSRARSHHPLGFTLVEMLVVMVLMGIMMSLVGPMVNNVVSKAQAQTERLRLESLIKKTSFRAFASGSGATLTFYDNKVEARFMGGESLDRAVSFSSLHFPRQVVEFSDAGFSAERQLVVEQPSRVLTLNLNNIIDGKGEVVDEIH